MGVFFKKKLEEKPETNAEKKAKRLEELKKEIEGKPKKISDDDMTDYLIGEGKEYPGNPDMPRIRGTLPPGFGEPQEIKKGGLIEIGKGKDYIKDLI